MAIFFVPAIIISTELITLEYWKENIDIFYTTIVVLAWIAWDAKKGNDESMGK